MSESTPVNGKALVDTNIVIALFAGDPAVIEVLQQKSAVFLCVPVIGELRYGALASSRVKENVSRLDDFTRAVAVLACDADTASFYAEIKFGLRQKGRPIPENDIWIAAIAQQHRLAVVSRDSHFRHIDGLTAELI